VEPGLPSPGVPARETAGDSRRGGRAREGGDVRFLCDHMLGTLAKWLRFLGNDVAYAGPGGDNDVKSLVENEGSVLLTRDRELAGRVAGGLCVTSDDLDLPLVQGLRALHLPAGLSMARWFGGNAPLLTVPK